MFRYETSFKVMTVDPWTSCKGECMHTGPCLLTALSYQCTKGIEADICVLHVGKQEFDTLIQRSIGS